MKKLESGSRVLCRSEMYSGLGVVQGLFMNELYGVQVLLDEPDADGHRVKRFALKEIKEVAE